MLASVAPSVFKTGNDRQAAFHLRQFQYTTDIDYSKRDGHLKEAVVVVYHALSSVDVRRVATQIS